jgi:hypothetical protein
MYPYAPPPPVITSPADRHVSVNAILMLVMAFIHLCGLGSALLNIERFLHEHPSYVGSPFERGELVGQMSVYVVALVWALSGMIWAPLNAWALFTRQRWARTSSLVYWSVQCLSCCCFPFGAYGVWSLMREDVKGLFMYGPSPR